MLKKDSTFVLDPSDGMDSVEELKKYARFLYASLQEKYKENLQTRKVMKSEKCRLLRMPALKGDLVKLGHLLNRFQNERIN